MTGPPRRNSDRPLARMARTLRWRSCCRYERAVGKSPGCGVVHVGAERNCWMSTVDRERRLAAHDVIEDDGGEVGAGQAHFA